VVIDKQLFARAKKDKFQKAQEKKLIDQLDDKHAVAINELKTLLIDKLSVLIKGQSSEWRKIHLW
jgi:DNA-directed RNA polymerase subunit beta